MILVPSNKVEKIIYFSTLIGLICIEITKGPFQITGKWLCLLFCKCDFD